MSNHTCDIATKMDNIDWELCCLCQSDKNEPLQTPKAEGLVTLGRDLNDFNTIGVVPPGITVSFDQLNDGSGISATLRSHNVKYHKMCRSYCSSSRVKRLRQKNDVGEVKSEQSSPKKLRSSGKLHGKDNDVQCCVICEGDDQNNLRKVATDIVDANLKSGAQTSNNFQLIGKLIGQAADAHAGDVYYHVQCYLHLRDNARATNRRTSECPAPPQFDPIATAQIVAIVEESDSVYKLSALPTDVSNTDGRTRKPLS